jgi:hypothetical protein
VSGILIFLGSDYAPAPSSAFHLGSFIDLGLGGTQTPTPALPPVTTPVPLIVVDSQTLTPGATAITVSGTPIRLASIPTAIVIGTNTIPVSQVSTPTYVVGPGPLVIDSQTRTPGGPAVVTLSDGQTVSFAQSFTALVIGSQTILPGVPGVTISGTEYSLALNATAFVVNGETVGSVVTVGTRTASGSSPAVYTGAASQGLSVPTDWQRVMALLLWGGLLLGTSCATSI